MGLQVETQIVKRIQIQISDDDVDDFLSNLEYLFNDLPKDLKEAGTPLDTSNVFSNLYKIWIEVKQVE